MYYITRSSWWITWIFRDKGLGFDQKIADLVWLPVFKFENLLDYKQIKGYGGTPTSSLWLYGNQSHELGYGEEFQLTFSCYFHLEKFPFDRHVCPFHFGNEVYSTDEYTFDKVNITYSNFQTVEGDKSIHIDGLALPFEFELEVLPIKKKLNAYFPGILISMQRNSLGQLLSGYYYPTTSFALLSMLSFLINPDVVN